MAQVMQDPNVTPRGSAATHDDNEHDSDDGLSSGAVAVPDVAVATVGADGVARVNGRWAPGQSGNPRGRQKTGQALTEVIRRRLPLDELFDIAWALARGIVPRAPINVTGASAGTQVTFEPMVVKPRERLAALNFLAQYGGFKPPDRYEVTAPEARVVDFGRLAPEELGAFERMLAKAAGEPDGSGTP